MVSAGILIWGVLPPDNDSRTVTVSSVEIKPITQENHSNTASGYAENGNTNLILSWPGVLRVGDVYKVRMTYDAVARDVLIQDVGDSSADETEQNRFSNLLSEAHLDVVGLEVVPAGSVMEPYRPGKSLKYFWKIRAKQSGDFRGMVWLLINFVPFESNDHGKPLFENHIPITAQKIEFKAVKLWGLSGPQARIVGGIGISLGVLMCFKMIYSIIEKCIKFIKKTLTPSGESETINLTKILTL